MSDDLSKQVLESEVARLQAENDRLLNLLNRPVSVTVQSPDSGVMQQIGQYLPQLTQMSTNLSYIASAIQTQASTINRIADQLEGAQVIKMPNDRQPKNGPKNDVPWRRP